MVDQDKLRSALEYLPRHLEFLHGYHPYVGTQVAIRVAGQLVFNRAYGVADLTTGVPLTVDHLFRIASHSKTFTAVACMQLVEQGRLRLDDTVGDTINELAGSPVAGVTIRELLSHGSGMIRDGSDSTWWQLERPFPNRDQIVALVGGEGRVMSRNDRFKYSNIGYSVLGMVVEQVSGASFGDYVQREIVDRLGLTNTGPEFDPRRADDYAAGHSSRATGLPRRIIDHIDTGAESAATGFYSTAADTTAYFQAHLDGDQRLVTDDSKRQMRQVQWQIEETWGYGLGLSITMVGDQIGRAHV